MLKKLISFVGYKLIWLSGVWGSTKKLTYFAPTLSILYVLYTMEQQENKTRFIRAPVCIAVTGSLAEQFVLSQYCYTFTMHTGIVIPIWLMAIWVAFPCVCTTTLRQPLQSWAIASIIGAVFAPLAYSGAAGFGGIVPINGWAGVAILSVTWALIMVMVHRLFFK